jgi:hypothetical protein
MSKGTPNNRQKDIGKLLREQGHKKGGSGFKAVSRPMRIMGGANKGGR